MRRLIVVIAKRVLFDPLTVFVAIGAAFFIAYWAIAQRGKVIDVPVAVQKSLAEDYEMMTGRRPDASEKKRLVDDYVADEVLFREAIDRGMHLSDKATRQRLVDRLRFLIAGAPAEPSEAQLIDFYSAHTGLYRAEPKITLDHVFFVAAPADPAAVLARLRAGEPVAGDAFWMGRSLPNYGESMIRGMFGPDFLRAVEKARIGAWIGPLKSPRGYHFVRVDGREGSSLMPYTTVRDQVRQDFLAGESKTAVDAEVAKLEKGYDVEIAH